MKISAKTDYACRALLELSLHWPNPEPLQVEIIAGRQNIPLRFLPQILIHLKQIGYVESMRGKKGGYLLRKMPREIKLSDIMENLNDIAGTPQNGKNDSVFNPIWQEVGEEFLRAMDKFNFEDICNRKRQLDETPTFQI